jgi:acyl carrier protein
MTSPFHEVKTFILSVLHPQLAAAGLDRESVPDDFDLRADGLIDSLGFLQLLGAVEARFGGPIDLTSIAPEQLANIGVLCAHIAAGARAGS